VVAQAIFCHRCGAKLRFPSDASPPDNSFPTTPAAAIERMAGVNSGDRDEPEKELWQGRYSSKAMLGAWMVSGLISLTILVLGIIWLRSLAGWLVLAAVILLPWIYNLSVLCYRRWSIRYRLTSQRFIHESGILRRVNNRIEVLDMDDISFEQTVFERLMGVGTIRIVSTDRSDPAFTIVGVDDVKTVSELFDDARRLERRRRGLHVEQI
jgi:uncharacterized membrane protein YdbT with pleckstrin-like domain